MQRTVVFEERAVPVDDHADPDRRVGTRLRVARRERVDRRCRTGASGYYEVVLSIDVDGKTRRSHAFFVVRPQPGPGQQPILLALGTNTWHAYNDFGGRNLYTGATQVSLQRPMAPGYLYKPDGAGQRVTSLHPPDRQSASHYAYLVLNHLSPYGGSAGWPNWELPFVRWAEREGYEFDVVTNADLEDHPELLGPSSPCRLYLSIGHDEYWSAGMRDTVEGFIGRGGNAAFLSGNTAFWQVRHEDRSAPGEPGATMIGFKGAFKHDPVFGTDRQSELTTLWSDHLLDRPENHMTGVSFTRGGYHRIGKRVTYGAGGYTLHRPEHWIFDGTGLDYGDVLGAGATIVGYECDGCDFTYRDGLPYPTGVRRHPDELRDPRLRARRPFHPHDLVAATRAARARRGRVHRGAPVRHPRPCGGRAHRPRPRHPRHLRVGRRRHGDHVGLDRLGVGPRRTRSARRADHPQHPATASAPETIGVRHRAFQVAGEPRRRVAVYGDGHGEHELRRTGHRPHRQRRLRR